MEINNQTKHPVMGKSDLTKSQIIKHILSVNSNPKIPIELSQFIDYYIEEAEIEGVNYGYAISQMLNETGYLKFGNDVKPERCNYCGLGATGTISGLSFPNVKIGIQAHIQHLKLYASTETLKQPCVDPRFKYIQRGISPNVEDLSGKWSIKSDYAQEILDIYYKIKNTQVDNVQLQNNKEEIKMLPIQKQLINYNSSPRNHLPKYIVIHDVGSPSSAQNNRNYFASGDRGASADFFVDSDNIIQIIDYHTRYSWNVGDGRGRYGIYNKDVVGIEMCLESDHKPSEATIQNTLDLTRYLMNELNIDINHVIRHYDVSRKDCPHSFGANNWAKWNEFKNRLAGQPSQPIPIKSDDIYKVEKLPYAVNCKVVNDFFYVRDSNSNVVEGRRIDIGDEIVVLDVSFSRELVEVIYPTPNGFIRGYIKNVPNCLQYIYQGQYHNGSTTEAVFQEPSLSNKIGELSVREKATPLYRKDGHLHVVYNVGSEINAKSGYVSYDGEFTKF